jgi:hypothetical protein
MRISDDAAQVGEITKTTEDYNSETEFTQTFCTYIFKLSHFLFEALTVNLQIWKSFTANNLHSLYYLPRSQHFCRNIGRVLFWM